MHSLKEMAKNQHIDFVSELMIADHIKTLLLGNPAPGWPRDGWPGFKGLDGWMGGWDVGFHPQIKECSLCVRDICGYLYISGCVFVNDEGFVVDKGSVWTACRHNFIMDQRNPSV